MPPTKYFSQHFAPGLHLVEHDPQQIPHWSFVLDIQPRLLRLCGDATSRENNSSVPLDDSKQKGERERERERERIVRAEKRCAWQISVCAGERQRRWKNDDVQERLIRARDPVIHHDPRLSTCHFRFSWRQPTNQLSRALRYRGAPVFLSTSRHTFRNCRRFNAAPLTVLLHRFVRHAI